MKTTLSIDAGVLRRLKEEAARQGRTISELVEAALRAMLERDQGEEKPEDLPSLPSFDGGRAYVDVANRESLYRAMEGP
ncbi:MAG: ribbon-helix-helix protein, CopG family [Gemmatimonadetes bacterium]|nr:ribbon-helix-helix protein, CopG family [Gemmatimonadota bacterium]